MSKASYIWNGSAWVEFSGSTVADTNYYPTAYSWTDGTTAGPTGSLTGTGMSAVSFPAIPSASGTISGIVTTGAQTFAGNKTFSNDVIITGGLTVNGTTTNINTTNLVVEDKNIILGDVTVPDNTTADGGGITLKGASDKTINWVNATGAWTSSEDFNLLTGKVYEINGTAVLSATTLGTGVTSSSLTSFGTSPTLVGTVAYETAGGVSNITIGGQTNGSIELGRQDGTASTPFIDFHAGATATDYDARIINTVGDGNQGGGSLSILATNINIGTSPAATSTITVGSGTTTQSVWIASGGTLSGNTKTVNIGTGAVAGSTTSFTIGSSAATTNTMSIGPITAATGTISNTIDIGKTSGAATTTNTINIGTGGGANTTTAVGIGATSGTSTTTINGALIVGSTVTGSGALTIASGGTNTNIVVNSVGTGTATFDSASTGGVNIGNGANAKTVTIGSTTTTATTAIRAGTGGITIQPTTTGTVLIGTTSTGAVTVGNATGGVTINGTTVADIINAGSATSTTAALFNNITTGTPGIVNNTTFNGTLNIASGAGTVNKTINIGTGSTSGTTAINIGSSSGATSNITLNGTVNTTTISTTAGGAGTSALSISTGVSASVGSGAINIASGAGYPDSGAVTLKSGNTYGNSGNITIDAGTVTAGTVGTINIGTANSKIISIGSSSAPSTTTISGTLVAPGLAWIYGTGADGAVTVTSNITLTRDMDYSSLTISGAGTIKTNGFKVRVSGTLDISAAASGAFILNGGAGGNSTANSAGAAGTQPDNQWTTLPKAGMGNPGIAATSSSGGNATVSGSYINYGGASGGTSGAGASGTGTTGGTGNTASNGITINYNIEGPLAVLGWNNSNYQPATAFAGNIGVGGGAGGGYPTGGNAGGGGGGGGTSGGCIYIAANTIARGTNASTSIIQAKGGNGGNGGNGSGAGSPTGGGGGGSGGGGGTVMIVYRTLTGSTIANAIDVTGGNGGNGGAGGSGGTAGAGGGNGGPGNILIINSDTGSASLTRATSGATAQAVGTTAGKTATTTRVSL